MSEFQYIVFRAIDAPVSGKNLQFMHAQSSRAEVTPWSFKNEYNFGSFRGDAYEMLRRGYDFHFHYANFGIRNLMFRLPNGLPNEAAAAPYFNDGLLNFEKDKRGAGGILCIEPNYESGSLEDLWEFDDIIEPLLPLRAEILSGDLRPLYLAALAVATDINHDPDETSEPPVPAGLNKLTKAQNELAKLYELGAGLLAAAARNSPPMPQLADPSSYYSQWLRKQTQAVKDGWLAQLLADQHSNVRSEMLAAFQKNHPPVPWPTSRAARTVSEITTAAESIQQDLDRAKADQAARARRKKLADMAANPAKTLQETEELVKLRSSENYEQIAVLLSDLREALALTDQSFLPEQHAQKLKEQNPRLSHLTGALRRKGFLKK